jgi:hypothetical protein
MYRITRMCGTPCTERHCREIGPVGVAPSGDRPAVRCPRIMIVALERVSEALDHGDEPAKPRLRPAKPRLRPAKPRLRPATERPAYTWSNPRQLGCRTERWACGGVPAGCCRISAALFIGFRIPPNVSLLSGRRGGLAVAGMHSRSRDRGGGSPRQERMLGSLAVFVALVFFLVWEFLHRGVYQYSTASYPFDDADEWRYTACSRLVEHGYTLFDQVFSAQPPLFFLSLASGMRVFGDSITGARSTEIAFGAVALAATAWAAWELAGPVGAAIAAAALAVSPDFLIYAHAVEAEIPMMALVTVSLALALTYRRTGWVPLLVLSGLTLAAATLVKVFALEAVLPVLWLIAVRHRNARPTAARAAVFGASTAIPVLLDLALVSPRKQWEQVVTLHDQAAGLHLPDLVPPATILREFLTFDAGLTALALGGIVALVLGRRIADGGFLGLWAIGTLAMLLVFRPLFPHHVAIVSAALAVCAGAGGSAAFDSLKDRRWISCLPVAAAVLAYLALLPRLAHADRHSLLAPQPSSLTVLAAYVERTTRPSSFIAVDNVQVAEQAHRFVPPPLCDPSNVRLLAGFLTAGDLISATRRYNAQLVIPVGNYKSVSGYMSWVRAHYHPVTVPGGALVYRSVAGD